MRNKNTWEENSSENWTSCWSKSDDLESERSGIWTDTCQQFFVSLQPVLSSLSTTMYSLLTHPHKIPTTTFFKSFWEHTLNFHICKALIGSIKCAFLNLSRQETIQIQNEIYPPEARSKLNLRAWIHNSDAQNYHLLPANTYIFSSNISSVTDMLLHMPRRTAVLSELSRLVPSYTNSLHNLQLRCSPAMLPRGNIWKGMMA